MKTSTIIRFTALIFLATSLVCFGAAAQSVRTEQDRPTETLKQTKEVERTGTQARGATLLNGGADITFEQVIKNPGNLDLAFRFAQTQIRRGDLLGASSTLERILLLRPDLPRVRVLYAVVLWRLDNALEAQRQFERVLNLPMPESLRVQINGYLRDLRRRQRRTRFSALLNFGYQFDSNRNASPSRDDLRGIFGPFFGFLGDLGPKSDHALQSLVYLYGEHDLGFQRRHRLFGSTTYYRLDQFRQEQLSIDSFSLEGGFALDFAPLELGAVAYWRHFRLSHEDYLRVFGGRVFANYSLNARWTLSGLLQGEAQEYDSITESPSSRLRRGPEYRGTFRARYDFSPRMVFTAEGTVIRKESVVDYYDYTGWQLQLGHTWIFRNGMFILNLFSWEYDLYDDADPFISPLRRRDHILRFRTTLGMPLGTLVPKLRLPPLVGDAILSVAFEYRKALSNISFYTYQNFQVSVTLTKAFNF